MGPLSLQSSKRLAAIAIGRVLCACVPVCLGSQPLRTGVLWLLLWLQADCNPSSCWARRGGIKDFYDIRSLTFLFGLSYHPFNARKHYVSTAASVYPSSMKKSQVAVLIIDTHTARTPLEGRNKRLEKSASRYSKPNQFAKGTYSCNCQIERGQLVTAGRQWPRRSTELCSRLPRSSEELSVFSGNMRVATGPVGCLSPVVKGRDLANIY